MANIVCSRVFSSWYKKRKNITDLSQQAHRPLAAPASIASVGAALCLKIHFFSCKFLGCYIEAAQNFFMYVTIFVTHRAQKLPLLFLLLLYWVNSKNFHVCDNFCNTLGTKTSLAFLLLQYWVNSKIFHAFDNFCNTLSTKTPLAFSFSSILSQLKIFSCVWQFL